MNDRDFIISIRDQCNVQLGTVTTPFTPPPIVVVPPPVGNVQAIALGAAGVSLLINMTDGVSYYAPLPVAKGIFGMTTAPMTPGGLNIQVFISDSPGDMSYGYKADNSYMQYGSRQYPCTQPLTQPESPGITWGPTIDPYMTRCVPGAGATPVVVVDYKKLFINFKMVGGSGPMYYFWNPQ